MLYDKETFKNLEQHICCMFSGEEKEYLKDPKSVPAKERSIYRSRIKIKLEDLSNPDLKKYINFIPITKRGQIIDLFLDTLTIPEYEYFLKERTKNLEKDRNQIIDAFSKRMLIKEYLEKKLRKLKINLDKDLNFGEFNRLIEKITPSDFGGLDINKAKVALRKIHIKKIKLKLNSIMQEDSFVLSRKENYDKYILNKYEKMKSVFKYIESARPITKEELSTRGKLTNIPLKMSNKGIFRSINSLVERGIIQCKCTKKLDFLKRCKKEFEKEGTKKEVEFQNKSKILNKYAWMLHADIVPFRNICKNKNNCVWEVSPYGKALLAKISSQ